MKKLIGLLLIALIFPSFIFAETIILKSGEKVEGKIIERTDDYIRIDFYDVPLTYYLKNIKSIDGKENIYSPKEMAIETNQEINHPNKASEPETSFETKQTYTQNDKSEGVTEYSANKKLENIPLQPNQDLNRVIGVIAGGINLFIFLVSILIIVACWKIFNKAGKPGWACIVPIYNLYVFVQIAGKPGWWLVLLLIPFVNFIISIILYIEIAKKFGKGAGFGIGMVLLPFIFFPILAFSDAQYES